MIAPMADLVESLKRVPLFAGVRDKELGRLAKVMRESRFNEGEAITTEGRSGVGFFLIEHGNATVSLRGEIVRTLGPGDHFGEMALLDMQGRSADITVRTDMVAAAIPEWEFKEFLSSRPEVAYRLLQTLSRRLREAEEARETR